VVRLITQISGKLRKASAAPDTSAEPKGLTVKKISELECKSVHRNNSGRKRGNLSLNLIYWGTGFSPSYSPATGLFYVATREVGAYYYKDEVEYKPGVAFTGGGHRALEGDDAYGAIRGLEAATGKLRWEFRLHSPPWAGVLSTAGGLVFGGSDEGNFYALDALTGKPLWDFQTGGAIADNPMSYEVDGKQYVTIAAGHALFAFGLP
jgi:outer membrane protein assembly factor BamB